MVGEFAEFFQELLYGEGAIFGFILIITICVLVTYRVKYASFIFYPVLGLLGILYLTNLSAGSNFMWFAFLSWAIIPLLIVFEVKRD